MLKETTDLNTNPGIGSADYSVTVSTLGTTTPDIPGKRLGAYWETKKPIPTDPTKNLPDGMIRLIGRYWSADSVHKIQLSASASGKTKSAIVKVKKPGKLFDPNVYDKDILNIQYNLTKGIKDNDINIDELCIEYGGIIGISPQIIKAQMFQESYKGRGAEPKMFYPTYRYEPWADYRSASEKLNPKHWKDYLKQPFYVTGTLSNPMGEGKVIPLDHKNVKPIYYPTEAISIADFVINNWGEYIVQSELKIVGSGDLTEKWKEYFDQWSDAYLLGTGEGAYQIATKLIQQYIRKKYTGYAQTRKAASYGLVQVMYITAKDPLGFNRGKTISSSDAPENLNDETIEMPFYKKFTEGNLKSLFKNKNVIESEGDWSDGWETTWKKSFEPYNGDVDYPGSVFKHSKKFYPQSKIGAL
jgi:hypothetical protein